MSLTETPNTLWEGAARGQDEMERRGSHHDHHHHHHEHHPQVSQTNTRCRRRTRDRGYLGELSLLVAILLMLGTSVVQGFRPGSMKFASKGLPPSSSSLIRPSTGADGRYHTRGEGRGRLHAVKRNPINMKISFFKRLPISTGVSVSLDKPAIPRTFSGAPQPVKIVLGVVGIIVTLALLTKLPGVSYLNGAIRDFCEKNNIELYDKLSYRYRLLVGKLEVICDNFKRWWRRFFPREVDMIPQVAFPVPCTLLERISIGGSFMRYRFQFPRLSQTMELDLGQQVSMMGSTPEDRLMKAGFVPLSERGEPGVLEVVSEKNSPDDPSFRILDTLAIGETIQVSPGPRLVNRHPGPINKLLIIISKLGVVPALQFLKALLPSSSYSINYANVVWVNERQDQYILHEDMQALFYKFNNKLDVFTVAERDLFMGDLAANPQFRMSVPTPTSDTLAIIAGPEFFVSKALDYLRSVGYAEETIVMV